MSHTLSFKDLETQNDIRFLHNSDFSGDVTILVVDKNDKRLDEIKLPAESLFFFAAEYIRDKKISELGGATTEQLLMGK